MQRNNRSIYLYHAYDIFNFVTLVILPINKSINCLLIKISNEESTITPNSV